MSLDFKEVFARHWRAYDKRFGPRIPPQHRRAAELILACGTAVLGGTLYQCQDCGQHHFTYHSCHHRNCPLCGHQDGLDWAEKWKAKLIPEIPYHFITFTVPATLRRFFRSHQTLCYTLLFQCTAQALQELAAEKKYLGASLGMLGVLHTWTRQLEYHPHIHYIVPAGGLTPQGAWVRGKNPKFLFPIKRLSIKTRLLFQRSLQQAEPKLYHTLKRSIWRETWNVFSKPVGSGKHVIDYLSRYVSRTAMGKHAILADHAHGVTIQYTDSDSGVKKRLHLKGRDFIRRFLQHVLPKGFRRVRAYGWLSPAAHKRFARIQALLDWKPSAPLEPDREILCTRCEGTLTFLEHWNRGRAPPYYWCVAIPLAS